MRPGSFGITRAISRPQHGLALLMCLLFLAALTLLGLSASSEAILQNKLAANLQEAERAKQSALSALSWAESWLLSLQGPAPVVCTEPCSGMHLHAGGVLPPRPEFENLDWWMTHGHEAGVDPLTGERVATIASGSAAPPVWIVTMVQSVGPAENGGTDLQVWYRVLARGGGRAESAVSVVESIVARPWPTGAGSEPPYPGDSSVCSGSSSAVLCGRFAWRELL